MKNIIITIALLFPFFLFGQIAGICIIKEAIKNKKYDLCIEMTKTLIAKSQETNLAYYYKATCEFEERQYSSSIISATKALKNTNPTDSFYQKILSLRSLAYGFGGKLDSAIIDNKVLINEFPNNIGYLLNMSLLYGEAQQFDKCIDVLQKALIIDSFDVYIINNLAFYYCEVKNYNSAINYAVKGLTLTKDSVWVASLLNSLGFAQANSISTEKGLQTINQSLTYRPNNPWAYFNLGVIYFGQNDITNACINFKKAKALGGTNMTFEYIKQYCQ